MTQHTITTGLPLLNKILVPLDDSTNSEEVLRFVIKIAAPNPHAQITLFTIANLDSPGEATSVLRLESFVALLASEGIKSNFAITESMHIPSSIVEWANEHDFEMVAMSTRGQGTLSSAILGSVSFGVLRQSLIPVMALAAGMINRHRLDKSTLSEIVVPLDGSYLSESCLPYAEVLAKSLGLDIRLVNVMPATVNTLDYDYMYGHTSYAISEKDTQTEHRGSREYLSYTTEKLRDRGVNVSSQNLPNGDITRSLINCVSNPSQSLFVMTTHNRSGLEGLLNRSVAKSVIGNYGGPVFTVPAPTTEGASK